MILTKRVALFVGLTLLAASPGYAFWSAATFQIHQEITQTALNADSYYTFGGQTYTFSTTAIAQINQLHKQMDDPDNYDPRDHFDGEHLADGFQGLQNDRDLLRQEFASQTPDPDTIWLLVGAMLHKIQDYYSHSTWIAAGHTDPNDIQDFGALTANTSPAPTIPSWLQDPTYPNINPDDCDSDYKTLLATVATSKLITTGYYQESNPNAGKCNHGLYGKNAVGIPKTVVLGAKCTLGGSQTPDGIARDAPCFSAQADVDAFYAAYALAENETEHFMKSITDELDAQQNGPAFCALLGIDPSTNDFCAPKFKPGVCANSNSCVMWHIDAVDFGGADPCDQSIIFNNCSVQELEAVLTATSTAATNYLGFQFLDQTTAVPLLQSLDQWAQSIPVGATQTSPTITLPLDSKDPTSTTPNNNALAGFQTNVVVADVPQGYVANALQSSAAYLQNTPTARPGTFTLTLQAVPTQSFASCAPGATCYVTTIYAQGTFDFWVDDLAIEHTAGISIGPHHVTGTFKFPDMQCTQLSQSQTTVSCPQGSF